MNIPKITKNYLLAFMLIINITFTILTSINDVSAIAEVWQGVDYTDGNYWEGTRELYIQNSSNQNTNYFATTNEAINFIYKTTINEPTGGGELKCGNSTDSKNWNKIAETTKTGPIGGIYTYTWNRNTNQLGGINWYYCEIGFNSFNDKVGFNFKVGNPTTPNYLKIFRGNYSTEQSEFKPNEEVLIEAHVTTGQAYSATKSKTEVNNWIGSKTNLPENNWNYTGNIIRYSIYLNGTSFDVNNNWLWLKIDLKNGIKNKVYNNLYIDGTTPLLNYLSPTPIDNGKYNGTDFTINISHYDINPDLLTLNWNGTLTYENWSATPLNWSSFSVYAGIPGIYTFNTTITDTVDYSNSSARTITVYHKANVTDITLSTTPQDAGNTTTISCRIQNFYTDANIENYPVIFSSNRTGTLATVNTNVTGWAQYNYTIPKTTTPNNLTEKIKCQIENQLSMYYYAGLQNNLTINLDVIESAPWYTNWNLTGGIGSNHNRTETIYVWANWYDNFMLNYSLLEHNGTGTFVNYSKTMSGSNSLQNYTLNLSDGLIFSKVGNIILKAMHAFDYFNWNTSTSPNLNFTLYGFADITKILPQPAAVGEWGQNSIVYCKVKDNFTGTPIENYNVSFYNNISGYLGNNITDITGKSYFTVNVTQQMNVTCNITNDLSLYYYANDYEKSVILVLDPIYPLWSLWGLSYDGGGSINNGANINKTQSIFAHSYWTDNYQLYYSFIEHNGSGTLTNYSIIPFPTILDSNKSWANYTFDWTNGSEFGVGLINVTTIYGSDKGDNINKTSPSHYFYLYGFANISSISINNTLYRNNTQIEISCKIQDNTSLVSISNYNISFSSNETGLIGTALTNTSGTAKINYLDTTGGSENITCNINSQEYYYTDISTKSLIVINDIIKPYILSNYNITPNKIHPGENAILHAKWNEAINSSTIYTDEGNFAVTTYENNWTNGTITGDMTWRMGSHNVSFINIYDQHNNVNTSSNNLTLNLYHYANISAITLSNPEVYVDTRVTMGCKVIDQNSNSIISGYNVSFYSNGALVNNSLSDGTGWAYAGYTPNTSGVKTILCNITTDNTKYYDPVIGGASKTKSLSVISLQGRACSGDTLSVPYNNYFDSVLNDAYRLKEGGNCAAGNSNFASWLTKITQRADNYVGYNAGPVDSTFTHSDGSLDAASKMILTCRSGGRKSEESFTHLYENIDPTSLIGFKVLYYYANRVGRELLFTGNPNNIVTLAYNSNQNTVNNSNYINTTLNPLTSACTGQSDINGATALYQEVDMYNMIPKLNSEGLSTIDLRFALYTQANYNFNNIKSEFYFNEFELYTKVLTVDMTNPISTTETYMNKTENLICTVPTTGANTSNVNLYPQYCEGLSCTNFTNLLGNNGPLRVNETTFACSGSSCTKTFNFNYTQEGNYSIRCNATNFNSYSAVSTSQQFIVYRADLSIKNITHDINTLNQYEVGDKIKEINVSVHNNNRGKAYSTNVTLSIINSTSQIPTWLNSTLPKTKLCSDPINKNSYCNSSFNNLNNGYQIPINATTGEYNFSINVTWLNVGPLNNKTEKIEIIDLRNTFNSNLSKNWTQQGKTEYISFNMTNLWFENITNVKIDINCPTYFTCLGNNGSSFNYNKLLARINNISTFAIVSDSNAPLNNYTFSFNVSYTNPRNNIKTWINQSNITINLNSTKKNLYSTLNITKSITNVGIDLYQIDIEITNPSQIASNMTLIDFVDSNFVAGSFNPIFNFVNSSTGLKYNGKIYGWDFTITNTTPVNISYLIAGIGEYKLAKNFMIGVE